MAVVTDISQVHRFTLERYHEWIELGAPEVPVSELLAAAARTRS